MMEVDLHLVVFTFGMISLFPLLTKSLSIVMWLGIQSINKKSHRNFLEAAFCVVDCIQIDNWLLV